MISKIKNLAHRQLQGEAGGVFRGMITLAMGAGLARILGIASIPILTRLYSPDDYGVLAVYTSIVAVLVPILTFRYVTAIPLPKTDAMAFNLFVLCAKLIAFGTLLIALALGLFGHTVLGWFSMEELAPYWWLIAIGVMGTATYELFSMWATRKKDYKVIAKTQFGQSLLGNVIKIGLGLLAIKPLGLVFGQIVAQSGGIGSYIKNAIKDFKSSWPSLSNKKQKLLASYYQDFPKYRLPSQFLMVLSAQAPVLMMASLYGKTQTGQLGLAMMALSLPVGLIGGAMGRAYYAEVAAIGKSDFQKIWRLTLTVQRNLFIVGLPAAIFLMLWAKPIFAFFFGTEWETAGLYASYFSIFTLLQFTSNPLVQVLNVVGSQVVFLLINIARTIGYIFIYYIANYLRLDDDGFVMLLASYLSLYYLVMTLLILLMVKQAAAQSKGNNNAG